MEEARMFPAIKSLTGAQISTFNWEKTFSYRYLERYRSIDHRAACEEQFQFL